MTDGSAENTATKLVDGFRLTLDYDCSAQNFASERVDYTRVALEAALRRN